MTAGTATQMDPVPPRAVVEIAQRLDEHGYEAWAVGGAVRDALAGRRGGDWDLATDARPDQVRRLFRRTVPVGIEHGTVGVLARDGVLYEVTTFRRDVETHGRHAVVEFATSLDEDLARRDFTFNAIAWSPLTAEMRDPWGGIADLRSGVLRTVGDPEARFAEDYLRVLRALRFAGHFGMRVEHSTWTALLEAVRHLGILSPERVREELVKVLTKTRHASASLELYASSGVLDRLYPELASARGIEVNGRIDAWVIAVRATDSVAPSRLRVRLAALLHTSGFAEARTRDLRGGWRFTGHERLSAANAERVLRRLRSSNAEIERVVRIVEHQSDLFPPDSPAAGIRRWLAYVKPDLVNDLFRLRIARFRARPAASGSRDIVERWLRVRHVLGERPVLGLEGLAVAGNDLVALGLEPGPRFGLILNDLLARVIEEPDLNDRDRLLDIVRGEYMLP